VIWLMVMIGLIASLARRRAIRTDPLETAAESERTLGRVIAGCTGLTAVIVVALTILSYASQRTLFTPNKDALPLRVIGHQWWWEIRYENPQPSRSFVTANEIYIPVALLVVASPPDEFEAWRNAQVAAAESPQNEEQARGKNVFLSQSCVMCHTIRGTQAGAKLGPDLTHVGGRRTLAAGMLPMSRGNLAAWIADPQGVKPGSNMPITKLEPDALNALSAYLMALK
jgi:cytochrome c oxidase subunit 2